jgi:hypothetical protein
MFSFSVGSTFQFCLKSGFSNSNVKKKGRKTCFEAESALNESMFGDARELWWPIQSKVPRCRFPIIRQTPI